MCSRSSMFAAAAILAANSSRSQMSRATDTDVGEWLAKQAFCDGKVAMWGGSYAGFDQWATAKEFPPHLVTIVPAAAAHPGLDYPSYNNIGMTYDMQWFTLTSGHTPQDNLFGDQKFWRTKFLDGYKKHLPFKSLDSFVGHPSANFQRILNHPTADAYYDAMLPTREQFQRSRCRFSQSQVNTTATNWVRSRTTGIISQTPLCKRAPNIFSSSGRGTTPARARPGMKLAA